MSDPALDSASFLLADCGSATTTVALFDLVEGSYRLIARSTSPSTFGAPWHDIMLGVQDATRQIVEITGRALLTDQGDMIIPQQRNGSGVDYFGVTISAAPPLRTYLAGLLEDVSVSSARHALESIYAQEVGKVTLDLPQSAQEQIQAILATRPDLIFIAGGTDGSASEKLLQLIETLELGTGLLEGGKQPDILFAGNKRLRERVTEAFSSNTPASVHIADNVRPSIDIEQLNDARRILADIYRERKISELPGIKDLESSANLPLEASGRAFSTMIDYFGALYRSQVLGIDLGSDNVVFAASKQSETGRLYIGSGAGTGGPLPQLFGETDLEELQRWLPEECNRERLIDFIYNKSLHPHTVAVTDEERFIEQAIARVVLHHAVEQAKSSWGWDGVPAAGVVILRGNALASMPRPGQALLTVLDAIQPTGVFSLAVDRYGILPMLGLLASQAPAAVVQILEGGALLELGWVVAPTGTANPGERALRIIVESESKGEYRIDAEFGELITVPLAPGASARLTLKPEGKVDIGKGPGRGRKITVQGGAVGLVVDARGRPLRLPTVEEERRERLRQWQWDMGG